jgi:uncharacterized protein YbjT (DUF2867 family)
MIVVTGARGTIGSALVRELLTRGVEVRAVTRDPAKIEPRPGLTVATEIGKADGVFLLAPAGPTVPDTDLATLRAAVDGGARLLVKLSAIGTPEHDDGNLLGSWHRPGEQAVRDSGLAWTILRPTTFASNTLAWASDIRAGRPVRNVFGDGRQGVIDPADVAAVAAQALTADGHAGRVYTLTGPELISVPEQMAELGEVLGTAITTVDVPPDEATWLPEMAREGAALVRSGGNAIVTDDVERVLGRRPGPFRRWAEANQTAFRAQGVDSA